MTTAIEVQRVAKTFRVKGGGQGLPSASAFPRPSHR